MPRSWPCSHGNQALDLQLRRHQLGGAEAQPSLQTLAMANGVAIWSVHRGLTDCIYMAQVDERTSNSKDVTQLPATNRRVRPHSIPPGSINFLSAAVQLAQQQQ
jgi:hypothetical protein